MIEIPAVYPEGRGPTYASDHAAGADLRAALSEPYTIGARERASIPTGVRLAIPEGYEGQVRPRSGLAAKHGVTVLNAPGTIDSDYRGELQVLLLNTSDEPYTIENGDRIAQLIIAPVSRARFVRVGGELQTSERGEGGFGSTGR
ncbi:MAG: dUTP diphosphatase [Spirochaetota bacterium]